jgi:NADH-ubiquinone oxidoreductase chain 4
MIQLGSDTVTTILIALRFWLTALIIIASSSVRRFKFKPGWFLISLIVLILFLNFTFSRTNILMFYVRFEATLIPTLILILGWGYQPERVQAGIYMLFYTLAASLPLLILIFFLKTDRGSVSILLLFNSTHLPIRTLAYVAAIMAFLVRMPIFLVHL